MQYLLAVTQPSPDGYSVTIPSASLSGCDDRDLYHTVRVLLRTLIKVHEMVAAVFLKSSPLPKVRKQLSLLIFSYGYI
jgi:hypothetical protein